MESGAVQQEFSEPGRVWLRGAVALPELERLRELAGTGENPGRRIGAEDPLFTAISDAGFTSRIARYWPGMRPVRVVSFDKTGGANWGLPWHQDRVIAVDRKADLAGYSNWSRKGGTWHCEPPEVLLQAMLFVRVHLDRNDRENGTMEIVPGSHRAGILSSAEARARGEGGPGEITEADAGDVLVLAMLTLHRSLPATRADSRRVLRVDYAACDLPAPLNWACEAGG